jgi:hypothetical protein
MAKLEDKPFDEYVTIKAARGHRQNISSARQAAEWLIYKWPAETDKAWRARKACLDALEDKVETQQPVKRSETLPRRPAY